MTEIFLQYFYTMKSEYLDILSKLAGFLFGGFGGLVEFLLRLD